MPRLLAVFVASLSLTASAQFVPPVPKTVTGGRALHRTKDIPLPRENEQWVHARSPHFLVLSSASERRTRDVVQELETVTAALQQVNARFAVEGEPTRVILFASGRDAAPYFKLLVGTPMPGAFVRASDGSGTMLLDGSRPFGERTVFHELVHNLLANSGSRLPLWLEEGVADYFSTAEVRANVVRFGATIREHVALLRTRPFLPAADLFAVDASSPIATAASFYAQSWWLVDWMMRTDRAAFYGFMTDVENGKPALVAFRERFHNGPEMAERVFESLLNIEAAPLLTVRVGNEPATASIEPLQRAGVIIELAAFLGTFEATRGDAERFLRSVEQDARAVAALAEMRSRDKRYDEATKLFERALALDPASADIRLSFAESLLGNAIGPFAGTSDVEAADAPSFRRARQLATEAMNGGGDAARANAVIGTSYLAEPDPNGGIEPLRQAYAARPARYDVALNLYALLLQSEQTDAAQKLYEDIKARAKTPQAIFAAKAVFVREQTALVNRLLANHRDDDAIVVMKQLIDATSDPNAKADLQRQLMNITEVRDANRQVLKYNQAVDAANAGHPKEAIAILDELLKTATDPKVISDATDFRTKLQKRLKGMRRSRGTL